MSIWKNMDNLDKLFVVWAFLFQIGYWIDYVAQIPF